ncbi:MAG: metallophosphoesterase family protein, partial [Miltoncostaeaceae bacterium]
MRLLHVADWHLGRRTLRESRAADHEAVIAEIVAIARDARPDLILHAGDLWDSARPGHDDLLRGVEA